MTVIYEQTSWVISWFGEVMDDSDEAIDLIWTFESLARPYLHEIPDAVAHDTKTMHLHDVRNVLLISDRGIKLTCPMETP